MKISMKESENEHQPKIEENEMKRGENEEEEEYRRK